MPRLEPAQLVIVPDTSVTTAVPVHELLCNEMRS